MNLVYDMEPCAIYPLYGTLCFAKSLSAGIIGAIVEKREFQN